MVFVAHGAVRGLQLLQAVKRASDPESPSMWFGCVAMAIRCLCSAGSTFRILRTEAEVKVNPVQSDDPFDVGGDPNKFEAEIKLRGRPQGAQTRTFSDIAIYRHQAEVSEISYHVTPEGCEVVIDEDATYCIPYLRVVKRALSRFDKNKLAPKLSRRFRSFGVHKNVLTVLASGPGEIYYNWHLAIEAATPGNRCDEHIEVLREALERQGYTNRGVPTEKASYDRAFPTQRQMDDFDRLLLDMYSIIKSKAFKDRVKSRKRRALREFTSNRVVADQMLCQFPKFTVVKYILEYRKDAPGDHWDSRALVGEEKKPLVKVVAADLVRFMNNLRFHAPAKYVRGHTKWLEFGKQRGPYVTVLFYLVDAGRDDCEEFLRTCGEVWNDCTDERGLFLLKSASFISDDLNSSRGVVTHKNLGAFGGLLDELKFYADLSMQFHADIGPGISRFSRSELPGAKVEKAARRRGKVYTLEVRESDSRRSRKGLISDDSIIGFLKIASRKKSIQEHRDNFLEKLRIRRLTRKLKLPSAKSSAGQKLASESTSHKTGLRLVAAQVKRRAEEVKCTEETGVSVAEQTDTLVSAKQGESSTSESNCMVDCDSKVSDALVNESPQEKVSRGNEVKT